MCFELIGIWTVFKLLMENKTQTSYCQDMKTCCVLLICSWVHKVKLSKKKKPIPAGTVFPLSFLHLSVPLCPLSLSLSIDTNAYSTHGSVSLEWLSISLSALLSLQLGTCTTILTSRGLPPAPNTLRPSVSLVVSSAVQRGRRRAAGRTPGLTATLSVCLVVGVTACRPALFEQLCRSQHSSVAALTSAVRNASICWHHDARGCVESDASFIRAWARSCLACPLLNASLSAPLHPLPPRACSFFLLCSGDVRPCLQLITGGLGLSEVTALTWACFPRLCTKKTKSNSSTSDLSPPQNSHHESNHCSWRLIWSI